jgi:hypothetical protein
MRSECPQRTLRRSLVAPLASRPSRSRQAVRIEAVYQLASRDAEESRGLGLIATNAHQRVLDSSPLERIKLALQVSRQRSRARGVTNPAVKVAEVLETNRGS